MKPRNRPTRQIAVTLHELATNAAKYGSLSVAEGHVDWEWTHDADGRLKLRWFGAPPDNAMIAEFFHGASFERSGNCSLHGTNMSALVTCHCSVS
jgi:two-component sensor histidine kinase